MKTIMLLGLGVVVMGVAVWFLAPNQDEAINPAPTDATTEQSVAVEPEDSQPTAGQGTLENLMLAGESVRCEFTSTVEGQISSGVFYTDGQRFRVDATITDPELGEMTSNMINNGDMMYTWGTGPQGEMAIKMTLPDDQASSPTDYSAPAMGSEPPVDLDQTVEYDCSPWQAESRVFTAPSDIEFVDMQAMMQEAMQGMSDGFEMPDGMQVN